MSKAAIALSRAVMACALATQAASALSWAASRQAIILRRDRSGFNAPSRYVAEQAPRQRVRFDVSTCLSARQATFTILVALAVLIFGLGIVELLASNGSSWFHQGGVERDEHAHQCYSRNHDLDPRHSGGYMPGC